MWLILFNPLWSYIIKHLQPPLHPLFLFIFFLYTHTSIMPTMFSSNSKQFHLSSWVLYNWILSINISYHFRLPLDSTYVASGALLCSVQNLHIVIRLYIAANTFHHALQPLISLCAALIDVSSALYLLACYFGRFPTLSSALLPASRRLCYRFCCKLHSADGFYLRFPLWDNFAHLYLSSFG